MTVTLQGDVEGRESRDVVATIPIARYRRDVGAGTDAGTPPVVAVASAPAVQVLENPPTEGNPTSSLSPAELATFAQRTYDVSDPRKAGDRSVTMLGTDTTLQYYVGTAEQENRTVPVAVHTATVEHEGDFITLAAAVRHRT